MPLCSKTYVRQHSFKCWPAFRSPRKTTVIYIILSMVLFFSGYPTLHKPTAEKLDLAESLLLPHFLLCLELNRKPKWNVACYRHEISSETSQFPCKNTVCSQNVEYEYKIAQRELTRNFQSTKRSTWCGTSVSWAVLVSPVVILGLGSTWAASLSNINTALISPYALIFPSPALSTKAELCFRGWCLPFSS